MDTPVPAHRRRREQVYCLRCFRELEGGTKRASVRCPDCRHLNVLHDHALFCDQVPVLRALEVVLKVMVVVLTAMLCLLVAARLGAGGGLGVGLIALAPILFGAVLWRAAGALTRRKRVLQGSTRGSLLPAVGLLTVFLADARVGAICAAASAICLALSPAFKQWKRRLILGKRATDGRLDHR